MANLVGPAYGAQQRRGANGLLWLRVSMIALVSAACLLTPALIWTAAAVVPPTLEAGLAQDDDLAGSGTWPLAHDAEVVHGFAPGEQDWDAGHRGVDLAGEPDQPVLAALDGTVTFAGQVAGRGVVVVTHGSTRTTYEPVQPSVPVGQVVVTGDQIGTLARAGSHCAPETCLHWGWRDDQTYFDPLTLVGDGPVRLLPLDGEAATVLGNRPGALAPARDLYGSPSAPTSMVREGASVSRSSADGAQPGQSAGSSSAAAVAAGGLLGAAVGGVGAGVLTRHRRDAFGL